MNPREEAEETRADQLRIAADLMDDMRTRLCRAMGVEDTGGRYSEKLRGFADELEHLNCDRDDAA